MHLRTLENLLNGTTNKMQMNHLAPNINYLIQRKTKRRDITGCLKTSIVLPRCKSHQVDVHVN